MKKFLLGLCLFAFTAVSFVLYQETMPDIQFAPIPLPSANGEDISIEERRMAIRRDCVVQSWAIILTVPYEHRDNFVRQIAAACGLEVKTKASRILGSS